MFVSGYGHFVWLFCAVGVDHSFELFDERYSNAGEALLGRMVLLIGTVDGRTSRNHQGQHILETSSM